jgi:hypothetical protein
MNTTRSSKIGTPKSNDLICKCVPILPVTTGPSRCSVDFKLPESSSLLIFVAGKNGMVIIDNDLLGSNVDLDVGDAALGF